MKIKDAIAADGEFMVNKDKTLAGVKVRNTPGDEKNIVDISAVRMVVTHPLVEDGDINRLVEKLVEKEAKIRKDRLKNGRRA
jgi:hypothetical protein